MCTFERMIVIILKDVSIFTHVSVALSYFIVGMMALGNP